MALWYDCGNGYVKTSLARVDLGLPVFLCCPGPSLIPVARQPGIMVAALTKAFPAVQPDIWFGMDDPLCYDRRLWWSPFIKIARGGLQDKRCEGRALRTFPLTFFADTKSIPVHEIFQNRQHAAKFCWHSHTMGVALHGLVWMGAKKIYLNGCDMGGAADWHTGNDLSDVNRARNRVLYQQQTEFLRRFAQHGREHGVTLLSCTPNSPINKHMDYVALDEALALETAAVPAPGRALHSMDADLLEQTNGLMVATGHGATQALSLLSTLTAQSAVHQLLPPSDGSIRFTR
jgi:hypothetical protein